jgi:D-alanyl-D-alanine carboxypeptidase
MAGTSHFLKHKKISCCLKAALLFLVFTSIFSMLTGLLLLRVQTVAAAESDSESMAAAFVPSFNLPAGLVFNAPERPLLYSHNADVPLEIPAASRLMALLVSADKVGPDELISISAQVAALASVEVNSNLDLESGMTLPFRYLALRMILQNSDAAALAIAEHLTAGEEGFLKMMQQRASELGMTNTEFYTLLLSQTERKNPAPDIFSDPEIDWGQLVFEKDENQEFQAIIDGQSVADIMPEYGHEQKLTATSSLNDLSRLAQALHSSRSAIEYLRVTEQLLSLRVENSDRVIPVRSSISRLFTLSEGNIDAAYNHRSDRFSLTLSYGETVDGIPVTTLLLSAGQSLMIDETLKLYEKINQHYQRTALTEAGVLVPGHSEKTESGETFGLQYLDTVYYVHPKDNFYLKDDVIYVGNAPYLLPIQKGSMTGQIIFEMLDGTRIPVRIGPDRDIISSNTILARLVSQLYNNENLGQIIIGLAALICLILAILLIREIVKLFYWRRMRRLERAGNPKH